jgi:hypothetical protein
VSTKTKNEKRTMKTNPLEKLAPEHKERIEELFHILDVDLEHEVIIWTGANKMPLEALATDLDIALPFMWRSMGNTGLSPSAVCGLRQEKSLPKVIERMYANPHLYCAFCHATQLPIFKPTIQYDMWAKHLFFSERVAKSRVGVDELLEWWHAAPRSFTNLIHHNGRIPVPQLSELRKVVKLYV